MLANDQAEMAPGRPRAQQRHHSVVDRAGIAIEDHGCTRPLRIATCSGAFASPKQSSRLSRHSGAWRPQDLLWLKVNWWFPGSETAEAWHSSSLCGAQPTRSREFKHETFAENQPGVPIQAIEGERVTTQEKSLFSNYLAGLHWCRSVGVRPRLRLTSMPTRDGEVSKTYPVEGSTRPRPTA